MFVPQRRNIMEWPIINYPKNIYLPDEIIFIPFVYLLSIIGVVRHTQRKKRNDRELVTSLAYPTKLNVNANRKRAFIFCL
jgi:hypothetical protein